jgi:hypothetical protein
MSPERCREWSLERWAERSSVAASRELPRVEVGLAMMLEAQNSGRRGDPPALPAAAVPRERFHVASPPYPIGGEGRRRRREGTAGYVGRDRGVGPSRGSARPRPRLRAAGSRPPGPHRRRPASAAPRCTPRVFGPEPRAPDPAEPPRCIAMHRRAPGAGARRAMIAAARREGVSGRRSALAGTATSRAERGSADASIVAW